MSQIANSAQLAKLQQAIAAHTQGQLDTAAAIYQEILAANPAHFDSTHLLGVIHMARGEADQAAALIGKALQINKKSSPAYSNLSMALRSLGRHEEALSACNKAIILQANNVNAHYNRALILLDLNRHEQALAGFRKAIVMEPQMAQAHVNMGVTLQAMERLDEALESFKRANTIQPRNADTLHNIGCVLQRLKRIPEAKRSFEEAIAAAPQHAEAHVALGECLLQSGDYKSGWQEYEWRWDVPIFAPNKRNFPQPSWRGHEDINGKTILVHAEQGLGDTLQFARYVKYVRERGAKVIFEVQAALKAVMSGLEGPTQVLARGEPLPGFDLHCPLLSLPLALDMSADFAAAPYINAPALSVEKWRNRLGPENGIRCGVVWAGSSVVRGTGLYRSMSLDTFKRIAESGASLVGMQFDVPSKDRTSLDSFAELTNFGPELQDFADTAGLIFNLDLVVTVDTATAHLAGAMGKPVWILLAYLPDWRWEFSAGRQTVWYPSANLFRQPKLHDWDSVMDQVVSEIRSLQRA